MTCTAKLCKCKCERTSPGQRQLDVQLQAQLKQGGREVPALQDIKPQHPERFLVPSFMVVAWNDKPIPDEVVAPRSCTSPLVDLMYLFIGDIRVWLVGQTISEGYGLPLFMSCLRIRGMGQQKGCIWAFPDRPDGTYRQPPTVLVHIAPSTARVQCSVRRWSLPIALCTV